LLAVSEPIRQDLHDLIQYFRRRILSSSVAGYVESISSVQAIVIGDINRTKELAQRLRNSQLNVKPILSPTVPAGTERLRICLHAFNSPAQVDLLLDTLIS
jgi:8-amino-7-oxononanoate synthase